MDGSHLHGFEVYFRLQALVGVRGDRTALSGVPARYYDAAHFGGAVAVVVGLVVWTLAPWISRLMEGVH